jgi:hypothetical protein
VSEDDLLPGTIPVFPLTAALLFPRGTLPLHIFEPRYRAMIQDSLGGNRLIGMIQPRAGGDAPMLYDIGGLGRISQFSETPDGRFLISLTGICRFRMLRELAAPTAYRQIAVDYEEFLADAMVPPALAPAVRAAVEEELKDYLDSQNLSADWAAVTDSDDEGLINTLSCVCPFSPVEKQALLAASDLAERADALLAFMRFARAGDDESGTRLQ